MAKKAMNPDELARAIGLAPAQPKEAIASSEPETKQCDAAETASVKQSKRAVTKRTAKEPVVKKPPKNTQTSDLFPKSKGETKNRQIVIRVQQSEYDRWSTAAKRNGVSLTVFIETVLNDFCDRNDL